MVNQKRKSAKLKTQIVLELLRGKPIEEVCREHQVTVADLSEWRDAFSRTGSGSVQTVSWHLKPLMGHWKTNINFFKFC